MGGGSHNSQPKADPWIPVPAGTNQNPNTDPNAILTPAIQYARQYMASQLQGLPQATQQSYPSPNSAQVSQFLSRLGVSPGGQAAFMAQIASKATSGKGNGK